MSLEAPHGLVRGIAQVLDGGRRDGPELTPAPKTKARRRGRAAGSVSSGPVYERVQPVPDTETAPDGTSLADGAEPSVGDSPEVAASDVTTPHHPRAKPGAEPSLAGPAEASRSGALDLPRLPTRVVQAVSSRHQAAAREKVSLTRVPAAAAPGPALAGLVGQALLERDLPAPRGVPPDETADAGRTTPSLPASAEPTSAPASPAPLQPGLATPLAGGRVADETTTSQAAAEAPVSLQPPVGSPPSTASPLSLLSALPPGRIRGVFRSPSVPVESDPGPGPGPPPVAAETAAAAPAGQPETHDEPAAVTGRTSDAPATASTESVQPSAEPVATAASEPESAEITAAPESPDTSGPSPVAARRRGLDLHRASSAPSVSGGEAGPAAPVQRSAEPVARAEPAPEPAPEPVSAERTAAPESPVTGGLPPDAARLHRAPSESSGSRGEVAPVQHSVEPVGAAEAEPTAESTAAPEPQVTAGALPVAAEAEPTVAEAEPTAASTAAPEPMGAERATEAEPPAAAGSPLDAARRPGLDLHRTPSAPIVSSGEAAPVQHRVEPAGAAEAEPTDAESTAAPEPQVTAGALPVATRRPGLDLHRAPAAPSVSRGEAFPVRRSAEPVGPVEPQPTGAEGTAALEPEVTAGAPPVATRRPGPDLYRLLSAPSVSPGEAAPGAPVRRSTEPVGAAWQETRSAEGTVVPELPDTAGPPPVTARRPGLDLRRALALPSVPRGGAALVQRSAEPVHHAGGLDLHRLLSAPGPLVARHPTRASAANATASELFESPEAPAPRSALQVPEGLVRSEAATPTAAPTPPTHVALPSPPQPAATVQRVTSVDGTENARRERLAEAPDDEIQELAGRVFDHIRSRLRTELLVDRERAGLLADRY